MSFLFGGGDNREDEREELLSNQDALLDVLLSDLATQQQFLEQERQTIQEQQATAFQNLDEQLQAQLALQEQGLESILNSQQGFISGLSGQNQELGTIIENQRQSQQQFREDQNRELTNINQFLSSLVGARREDLDRSLDQLNQTSESIISRSLQDSPEFAARRGQIVSEQQAETQELDRARARQRGAVTQREQRRREREQGSRLLSRRRGFARTNRNNRILRGT